MSIRWMMSRSIALLLPLPVVLAVACSSSTTATPTGDAGTGDASGPGDDASGGSDASSDTADAAPLPPNSGGTGAFGIVTVNGKQKLYLPQDTTNTDGHAIISVVDVGVAGNGVAGAPALITDIDLGVSDIATTTGGDPSMVVAASVQSHKVWFIDPTTDTLVKTIDLDATYGASGFSGGGGVVTGIAFDSPHHRAILSVWNGFALVDLTTQSVTTTILAPPSENFGFDSVHGYILAPFYDCTTSSNGAPPPFCSDYKAPDQTVMTDGLNVIDLKDNTVYTFQNSGADDVHYPVGGEPDSASVDPTTGVVVVASESGGYQNVIDLSKGTFDKGTKTVTAPWKKAADIDLEGVAVESTSHLAFWEGEGSSSIAVGDLTSLVSGGTKFLRGSMPTKPDQGGWGNLGDPHGIAVTAGIRDGKAVGVLVDSGRQWVARVDLAKVLATTPDSGTQDLTGDQVAPAVTYLDARTKP